MRYQYTSPGFRKGFSRPTFTIPSGVKLLVIINIVVFVLTALSGQRSILFSSFGLGPSHVWSNFKVWQLFTYLFVHGGFLHIFFNMFVLWMFGIDLEMQWGKNEFLLFYFTCGIGAGLMTVLFSVYSIVPIVGASGAIYGLLVAYGFTYPNRMVYLYGLFPLKVKYMVLGLGVIAFFASLSANQSNVSHITHLSGMIIGVLYIYFIFNWKNIKMEYYRLRLKNLKQNTSAHNDEEVLMKKKVDEILDKLNASGWDSLTEQEEKYLTRASKQLFGDRPPN